MRARVERHRAATLLQADVERVLATLPSLRLGQLATWMLCALGAVVLWAAQRASGPADPLVIGGLLGLLVGALVLKTSASRSDPISVAWLVGQADRRDLTQSLLNHLQAFADAMHQGPAVRRGEFESALRAWAARLAAGGGDV